MPIRLTPTVKIILIVSAVAYLLQHTFEQFFGIHVTAYFGLVPSRVVMDFWIWQLFTYQFLHGPPWHLFFNLLMLVFIGGEIEGLWGRVKFLKFYFFCVLVSGLAYLLFQIFASGGLFTPMIGASGGIFGLLLAYGIFFGDRVMLFMMIFPMKAKHFIWILAGIEFMTLLYAPGGALASLAHLAGMGAGFSYLWVQMLLKVKKKNASQPRIKGAPRPKPTKKSLKHLRLVINNPKDAFEDRDTDKDPKTWH